MKRRSKWSVFVEADGEMRSTAIDLIYLLSKYLAFPDPKTWKELTEYGESYARWFHEVRQLKKEIGQKLQKKKTKGRDEG
jgi:hypothetical protein